MRSKKDSKKSKAILLRIDIILAVLLLALLGCCGYMLLALNSLPQTQALDMEIRSWQERISQLESRIEEKSREAAQAEAESLAAYTAAQEALAAVQIEADAVAAEHAALKAQAEEIQNSEALMAQLREDIARIRTEYGQATRILEDRILAGESDYRICYLTFDDGPSYMTSQFLDKIDELDIRVTFFTIGVQMGAEGKDLQRQLLRREAISGHAIANHTYTHDIFGPMYQDINIFLDAVKQQDELVYQATGMHPNVLRFPAGSYYCPFRDSAIAELEKMGYGYIDWICNAYDSGYAANAPEAISGNVIWQATQDKVTVVLMHDWRSETLAALETIVKTLKQQNYLFLPLFKESSTVGNAVPKWG